MHHIYHYQNYGPNHRVCQLPMQQSYLNSVLFLNNSFLQLLTRTDSYLVNFN